MVGIKKVHYISGSRADFGLMRKCLQALDSCDGINLGIVVTGQHLSSKYGETQDDIKKAGLEIVERIYTNVSGDDGLEMALAYSETVIGLSKFWSDDPADLIILLGDRPEMLAAAVVAVMLNIHCLHIHGGERSGTIDDRFRHAISKLAHYHVTASIDARNRLLQMGVPDNMVVNLGAPGLVGILDDADAARDEAKIYFDHSLRTPKVVCTYHPVVQEQETVHQQMSCILKLLVNEKCQGILLMPNSDAGGREIESAIERFSGEMKRNGLKLLRHLPRSVYLACLSECDVLVGNSSSGIIESASFGVPFLNIGTRQNNRLRNENTFDCPIINDRLLEEAFSKAISSGKREAYKNQYYSKSTDRQLSDFIQNLKLDSSDLSTPNSY